ncbi:MAG: DUF1573 domain-containing protein [Salibacteraceae bacterium]
MRIIPMKKYLLGAAAVAMMGMVACNEQAEESNVQDSVEQPAMEEKAETTEITADNVEALTSIEFTEEAFDFGEITQGEKVEHTFMFKNTGENDLVIVSAKGSCGCTIPKWPKEPIAPGATGEMFVVFNSDGKKGKQHKKVSVIANTEPATTVVALRGDVIVPEADAANAETSE